VRRAARLLPFVLALCAAAAAAPAQAQAPSTGATGLTAPGEALQPIRIHYQLQNKARLPITAVITSGTLRVVGTVTPYAAGQSVFVRTFRGERRLYTRRVTVTNAGNGIGHFVALIGVGGRPAPVTVQVSHPASNLQAGLDAEPRSLPVVAAFVAPGQRDAAARLLQEELAGLHYAVPSSGVFDDATQRAVIAFRKMTDEVRSAQANRTVFELLADGAGAFKVRFPHQGAHFEGDLTHQVLAEVLANGQVRRLYEMSSGKPSTPTVIGTFQIYSKTPGINEKGMVDANYFIRGYAIHGYAEVPTYAASHGCLRIPVPDAAAVFDWAQYGYPVDVYYRDGGGSTKVQANAGP
jgi:hypothetical protein